MLTYRTGAAGAPSAAAGMADHLLEQTLTPEQAALATYYQQGMEAASPGVTVAEPRRDLDPRMAAVLGLDPNRAPTREEIAHLLNGNRTDGAAIPGKQIQKGTESLADILGLDAARVPSTAQIAAILAGKRADGEAFAEKVAGVARSRFLELYGVPREREASEAELAEIGAGQRADGTDQRRGPLSEGLAASRARIGYVDLCWSADKSVSLAWAFAPTEAERNIIAQAHRDAVSSALLYVEAEIGQARRGKAGQDGAEPGQIGWVRFDHYASRPTVEVPRVDRATGEAYTELVTLKVAGDPQLHTHVAIPNVVLTEGGRVGGLDLQRLDGRIKEFGAYYQAHLATNLRRHGVEVALDSATGSARLTAIPEPVRATFSKRTQQGTEAARSYARSLGLDWDSLDAERKIGLAKQGVQGDPRQVKQDDLSDWASWRRQAADLSWQPASVLRPDQVRPLASREARLEQAYAVGRDLLDRELQRRAVLDGADARVAAARGLIASGIESAEEIGAVTRAFAQRGVRHDGEEVGLLWGMATDARGQEVVKLTTTLHADRETELVDLARAAASDRSAALSPQAIAAAVARSGYDFTSTHGARQRAVMDQLGQGGRLAVAIGVAGSGKSTLLAPLVDAWAAEGRTVHGAALAWRQSEDLAAAGIARERLSAMSVFLDRSQKGQVTLDRQSVVVVDELGLLGTRQLLDLLRLQREQGFQLVAVGDPKQCQSIEAGPVIGLLRRALGDEAIPELLTTIRQNTERERETSLLFREGQAAEALARKREGGTALLVPGGYREAVARVAALWQSRREAHAHDPAFSLTVSAPTNADAREIAAAIREHRRAAGELGADAVVVKAADQMGAQYDLPLAVGDRVRLFARTNAAYADKSRGIIGNNGSVLEVRGIGAGGVTLRNAQGREGFVKWDTLRDPDSQRIRLSYGDVLSIDATQGLTSSEHIEAMPAGSQAVNAYKAYTQASRHRERSWLVTADGAERREIAGRRPLGDPRPIREADVWANMARNLARAPEKASALDFLKVARDLRRGAVQSLQAGLQPAEQRQAEGRDPFTLRETLQRRREAERVAEMTEQIEAVAREQGRLQQMLSQAVQAIRETVRETVKGAAPVLRQAAEALRERQALTAVRAQLLDHRIGEWRQGQGQNPTTETEHAAQARFGHEIRAMPKADLHRAAAEWRREQEAKQERAAQRQRSGPSMSR
jgi:hypothetical protein